MRVVVIKLDVLCVTLKNVLEFLHQYGRVYDLRKSHKTKIKRTKRNTDTTLKLIQIHKNNNSQYMNESFPRSLSLKSVSCEKFYL